MKTNLKAIVAGISGMGLLALGACTSIENNTALEALSAANDVNTNPYVSAYIEFPGPQKKWAGPASFSIKIDAKGDGAIRVDVHPDAFGKEAGSTSTAGRKPASEARTVMTAEGARAHLAFLAEAIKTENGAFTGCLYPIRARLIRNNGEVLEKYGCRGQNGWPRVASDLVANAIMRRPQS